MRLLLASVLIGASVSLPLPANAHCENVQKLCGFGVMCWQGANNIHIKRVREGVANKNGQEVWGEFAGCGSIEDNGGKACSDAEYVMMGEAVLKLLDTADKNACIALPP